MRCFVLTVLAALVLAASAASSYAATRATTEPATQVSYTTAVLNGTANPSGNDAAYQFQYGTTPNFGKVTPLQVISHGPHHASATLTRLAPGVTYYFRLLVQDNSYSPTPYYGNTLTFHTTPVPPGSVATTGAAVEVTDRSANLNGVANTTDANTAWAFQYGTTTAYGKTTPVQHAGKGLTAVSVTVVGLKPGVRYHYRLVVAQGSYPTVHSFGQDAKLTTWGHLKVRGHRVRVRSKHARIRLVCKGGRRGVCRGRISITTAGAHGTTVPCAGAGFSIKAGKRRTLHPLLRGGCRALLAKARAHRLRATLHAGFAGRQAAFVRKITLAG